MIIDETFGVGSQSHTLTTILNIDGQVVRVTVKRDSYEPQSYAVAALLNSDKDWTTLLTAPTSDWYNTVPSAYDRRADHRAALARVSAQLVERTRTVLAVYA
jgi:hypothetical protein